MSSVFRVVIVLLLICAVSVNAQKSISDDTPIPFNPDVMMGRTSNDVPFFILKNSKPEKRLDLILTVNAGAVLEDADQDGLAHFCEHMAFNGTREFPKLELVSFLESTGIRFGADLNAYTNQDETVYMLTVPITSAEGVIKAVKVLRDWAGYVTYDDAAIEAERGVVLEEWRLGRGAQDRLMEKHFPTMYNNSAYAHRDVIGDTAVLKHAPPGRLRDFYKKWYRPENMAIIAVGDMNPGPLAEIIQKYFVLPSDQAGENKMVRPQILIPDNPSVAISIASDPEQQAPNVQIMMRRPADTVRTYGDFKKNIVFSLAATMINARLAELTQKAKPPFASAGVGRTGIGREYRGLYAQATSIDKSVLTALSALMTEILRVKQHGFTEGELQRSKEQLMANMNEYYENRNTTESGQFAQELARYVLQAESVPGIEHEMDIYRHYVGGITAAECGSSIASSISDANQVILISVPEGNGYSTPKEQQVRDLLAAVAVKKIDPYVDKAPTKPLMETLPKAGAIVKDETVAEIDARKLTLSNGATVFLKKTAFKNDEILVDVRAYGGQSLGDAKDHVTLSNAATLIDASGIAEVPPSDLQKMMQGKTLGLTPFITMEQQGMSGSSSPRDLEMLMQMMHLYFTSPRLDSDAVQSWMTRATVALANKEKSPESALFDSVTHVMSSNHPRTKPLTADQLKKIDPKLALNFYKQRFSNAAGFTFTFIGNFDEAAMEEYVKTYIASLPSDQKKKETFKDAGVKTKRGRVACNVIKGEEPKSFVALLYNGTFKYGIQTRYDLVALSEVMSIRLREQMREEAGGVYFVSVNPNLERIPDEEYAISVVFSCAPERVDELIKIVEKEVEYLKKNKVEDSYVQKVREIQSKEREVSKRQNQFWSRVIPQVWESQEPWSAIDARDACIAALNTDQIKASAAKYLDAKNFARFVLKPAK